MSAPPPTASDPANSAPPDDAPLDATPIDEARPSVTPADEAQLGATLPDDAPARSKVPAAARAAPSLAATALRTWLRYLVPLTVLSAVALSPLVILGLQVSVPRNAAEARTALTLGWAIVGVAWLGQLVLVGGAAATTGPRRSQLGALGAGLLRLLGAILPCLAAAAAVTLASLAFVVPGVVLFVLLALTGASPARGVPGALRDSLAVARAHLPAVIVIVIGMLALDAAIGLGAHHAFAMSFGKPPAPLPAGRNFVRAIVAGLVVLSPLPAMLLATVRRRAEPASSAP